MHGLAKARARRVGITGKGDVEGSLRRQPVESAHRRGVSARILNGLRGGLRNRMGAGYDIEHIGKLRRHDTPFIGTLENTRLSRVGVLPEVRT